MQLSPDATRHNVKEFWLLVIQFNLVPHIKGRIQTQFENRVLRNMFEPKRKVVTGGFRKLRHGDIHDCTPQQMLLGRSNQGEWCGVDGLRGTHVREDKGQYGLAGKHEGTAWKT